MRRVSIFVAAIAILASCAPQGPKASLKTEIDSLSYATGIARVDGLYEHLMQQDVDTAYIADFLKGFNVGASQTSEKEKAYLAGVQIGQIVSKTWVTSLNQQIFEGDTIRTISKDNLLAGFIAGVKKDTANMTRQFAVDYSTNNLEQVKERIIAEKYNDNKEAGERFLAENKTKDGVQTTASGVQYKIIKEGRGDIPTATSTVSVHYRGTLIDGTEFDSSYKRDEPTSFVVNRVIQGWTEALTIMPVGSKWELYIPQELAYGSRNSGTIKPFSTLIFEVELLGIEKN